MANRPRSLRRIALLSFLALAGLAGLLSDALVLGPLFPSSLPPERPAHAIPNTDLNPYGVNVFLDQEVDDWKKRTTMEMISDAGIGFVKQQFSWEEIEPDQPGRFWDDRYGKSSWAKFDQIVDLAEEYGLEIIARLDRPPAWARPADTSPGTAPSDPHTYAEFVRQFVQHYRGRIHYIQIWNEPNLDNEWVGGQPVDPRGYVTLLRLAYEAAKEVDPNIQILSAPMAARITDDPNRVALSDLTFLEEMYRAGAKPYFDIMSATAYGFESPPEEPPAPDRMNFRRVELVREIMERHDDGDKAIWFNEYGWNASPADMPTEKLLWGRVSDAQQAAWTVQGVAYADEHWPWAGVFSIWYFRQVGHIAQTDSSYYFRMVNVDFTPLPVYAAVQEAAATHAVATPGWYQETAAPVVRRGEWELLYDGDSSGRSYAASNEPGSRMTLAFLGTDLNLRVRRGPSGGRLLVTVDGASGRGTDLPRDGFGQAYLELYSPQEEWVEVALLAGLERELPPRQHLLELVVAEDKAPESDGHLCAVDAFAVGHQRSYLVFWVAAGLLLGGTLAALAGLIAEIRRSPAPRIRPAAPINPWTLRSEMLAAPGDEPSPDNAPPKPPASPSAEGL